MGLTRDDRGVATYTVDDAPTRNALGTAALRDLDQALAGLAADPSVRAVVLTAPGALALRRLRETLLRRLASR